MYVLKFLKNVPLKKQNYIRASQANFLVNKLTLSRRRPISYRKRVKSCYYVAFKST